MIEPTIQETDSKWRNSNISRVYIRYFDRIIAEIDIKPTDKVLEIGCGLGYFGEYLKGNYTGVEIEPTRVAFCNSKGLNVVEGNAESLPFPDGTFDKVVWVDVLHHTNYKAVAKEIKRVLKPNGKFAGIEPYPSWVRKTMFKLFNHHEKFEIFIKPNTLEDEFLIKGYVSAGYQLDDISVKYKIFDMFYPLSGGFSRKEIFTGYIDFNIKPLCWKYIISGVKHGL